MEKQLAELKEQNETLKSNLNLANQKPGRAERRQLEILENAVSAMREQAPAFSGAWEKALRDSEANQLDSDSGLKKLMRRVLPSRKTAPVITVSESEMDTPRIEHDA